MGSSVKGISIFIIILMFIAVAGIVAYGNEQDKTKEVLNLAEGQAEEEAEAGADVGVRQIGDDTRAFLQDETFFDSDSPIYTSVQKVEGRDLALLMTSVEKDLRIRIVNNAGALVEGIEFCVILNRSQEYLDEDRNGVIYIENLSAGEYEVELKAVEGYEVPQTAAIITVKQSVEYVAIDDIGLLIATEDKVDAAREDLEVKEAKEDADSTEITGIQRSTTNVSLGIDVSKWNGDIDWNRVKQAGVEYAIIRVGYRGATTGTLIQDPYFETNIKGAAAAGIPVGVYFFTQAINVVEAVEEASMVLSLCKDYSLNYPIFIDTEGAGGNGRADGLDVATRTQVCEAFCKTIENAGYQAGVYGARNWFNNMLNMDSLEDFVIWLAEYREKPLYQGDYHMWQYTSNGSIDGISGRVDLNLSYHKQGGGFSSGAGSSATQNHGSTSASDDTYAQESTTNRADTYAQESTSTSKNTDAQESSSSGGSSSGSSYLGGSSSGSGSSGGSSSGSGTSGSSSSGSSSSGGSSSGSGTSGSSSSGGSSSGGSSSGSGTSGSSSSGGSSSGGSSSGSSTSGSSSSGSSSSGSGSSGSSSAGANTYASESITDPSYAQESNIPDTYGQE